MEELVGHHDVLNLYGLHAKQNHNLWWARKTVQDGRKKTVVVRKLLYTEQTLVDIVAENEKETWV
jgi:hypothetical protein